MIELSKIESFQMLETVIYDTHATDILKFVSGHRLRFLQYVRLVPGRLRQRQANRNSLDQLCVPDPQLEQLVGSHRLVRSGCDFLSWVL